MYSALHPSIGLGIGHRWSLSSRLGKGVVMEFLGDEKEDLIRYARTILAREKIDYFIFGHRHLAMSYSLDSKAEIIFLGDWIKKGSYAEWDGVTLAFRTLN
jgi:UDP-2,3-diacylglucosamine hydrolase